MMSGSSSKATSKRSGEFRYATRLLSLEKGRRSNQSKEVVPLKTCKQLLKSDEWENSKFSLTPKSGIKKSSDKKVLPMKHLRKFPKNREKVVIVSKKSSSVRVVKSGSQKCLRNVQRSVSVKKVSYSTSVILSSDESDSEDYDDVDVDDEEEDDEDEEDNYHDKSKLSLRKKHTVVKHTVSKTRNNNSKSKNLTDRCVKKSKALKLLREKASQKKKIAPGSRELRPRFPYSPLQEWPTARAHRMASLNAMAKVHVLYENEGRPQGEPDIIDLLSDNSLSDSQIHVKEPKPSIANKDKITIKVEPEEKKKTMPEAKPKVIKRRRKRKHPCDVEIIDTRVCKRMASLNAQAILAASYVQEKPKRREKHKINDEKPLMDSDVEMKEIFLESSCNLKIVDSLKDQSSSNASTPRQPEIIEDISQAQGKNDTTHESGLEIESDFNKDHAVAVPSKGSPSIATESVSEVGLTQYTKVTKVQINTTKEMKIKEESKAERKIERIVGKDDVAITRTYHYQSNTASQSYSVRMETTYKPSSRNCSPSGHQRSSSINQPHVMGAVMPTRQSYYNYQNRPGILASQAYPLNRSLQPILGMDQRQYGSSAFTMPHYPHHPTPMSYRHNEYGYYQPAGPMIQTPQEQYTIHKPVPYHPQPQHSVHNTKSPQNQLLPAATPHPDSRFLAFRDSSALKSQYSTSSFAKHMEPSSSRMICAPPPPTTTIESQIHQLRPTVQKPDDKRKQQQSYKYQNNQGIAFSQHPMHQSYTLQSQPNSRFVSSQIQQSTPPSHVASHQSNLHHQNNIIMPPNQYLPPITAMTTVLKTEPLTMHSNAFEDTSDCSFSKYGQGCYKDPSLLPRESSQSNDKSSPVWQSPLVMDIDSGPKNTKTYFELDVPKACPQERIVVIDVDKEEQARKNIIVAKQASHSQKDPTETLCSKSESESKKGSDPEVESQAQNEFTSREKSRSHAKRKSEVLEESNEKNGSEMRSQSGGKSKSEVKNKTESKSKTEVKGKAEAKGKTNAKSKDEAKNKTDAKSKDEAKNKIDAESKDEARNKTDAKSKDEAIDESDDALEKAKSVSNNTKESEGCSTNESSTKKKELSALIRRARLHGKQRTYRDSENRPLVPYTNNKKEDTSAIDIAAEYQIPEFQPHVSIPQLTLPKTPEMKPMHGWSWAGKPAEKLNDEPPCLRLCYPAIRHEEGDIIRVRDCVLLKSGARKSDLPYIAKVTALWTNTAGDMTMSLFWYYRPEHTELGRKSHHTDAEIFASKHCDTNSVACIEDKCFVLTFGEYCRYRRRCMLLETTNETPISVVPPPVEEYPRKNRLPPACISPDMVFFCRKVYDFRQKRILKNPT